MIVLDTHVWLYWLSEPRRLSTRAESAISEADTIAISAISCWEVTLLSQRRRLELDRPVREWVRRALSADARVRAIPLDPDVAVAAATLEGDNLPADPADRFILATARSLSAPLVTRDARLRAAAPDHTLW